MPLQLSPNMIDKLTVRRVMIRGAAYKQNYWTGIATVCVQGRFGQQLHKEISQRAEVKGIHHV